MNLVDEINNQLSSGILGKLSSLTGAGETKTKMTAAAVVPALLSAFGKLASTGDGAQKLAGMVSKFTPQELGSIATMTSDQANSLLDEGKSSLSSLFGGGMLGTILSVLSKFTNMDPEMLKKLMGYLTPVIFGTITKKFGTGGGVTGSTLSALFAEQKQNIANALPAGLSLDAIPGVSAATDAAKAAAGGGTSMLLPLLLILALAAGGYWYFFMRTPDAPKMPDIGKLPDAAVGLTKQLTGFFTTATDKLNSIKDVATAEAALPSLQDLTGQIDTMRGTFDKLPDVGKSAIKKMLSDNLGKLKELVAKVLALPGVGEKLKPVLDSLTDKLSGLAN